ncbi:hypothetical protein VPNG_04177 [Cytospora leucostoma]|uniref:Uncharacterized protein n=1 Tax=Cytospora leucostoma TaxID=1230097 RepID=A0A423XD84_9PEZI|nr:hypothetical protein VPNG_04177 [Cytospora leucostoma]
MCSTASLMVRSIRWLMQKGQRMGRSVLEMGTLDGMGVRLRSSPTTEYRGPLSDLSRSSRMAAASASASASSCCSACSAFWSISSGSSSPYESPEWAVAAAGGGAAAAAAADDDEAWWWLPLPMPSSGSLLPPPTPASAAAAPPWFGCPLWLRCGFSSLLTTSSLTRAHVASEGSMPTILWMDSRMEVGLVSGVTPMNLGTVSTR